MFVISASHLLALFLLTVFADKLAAFTRDDGHVRGSIFHRDDRLWLQQDKKHKCKTFRWKKI